MSVIDRRDSSTMDWVPVAFITFKIAVLATGMFFAVKWHYDQDKKKQNGNVLKIVGKTAAIFALSLLVLLFLTFTLARMLGLELSSPR
jgi:uncharacterized membrane protein YidH (DUF202 family)